MNFLLKARGAPAGTRRTWADGVYVKGGDHKWHKEKIHKLAKQALNKHGKKADKALTHDFQESAEEYIDWLNEKDLNPAHPENSDHMMQFWADHYEDKDWHTDDGYWKWSKAIHEVAKKFHKELAAHGKSEVKKEKSSKNKAPEKIVESRRSFEVTSPLDYAIATDRIARRMNTSSFVFKYLDGKEITMLDDAKMLIGHTIEVNGERGVVLNYYMQKKRVDPWARRSKRVITGIPLLVLMTADGQKKVDNKGPVKLLADPTGPEKHEALVSGGNLQKAGIKELVFDEDIDKWTRDNWSKTLQQAFRIFNEKLSLNFHGKVKIRVYGSGGPKRGARADYSPTDKVIRLSTEKKGSSEALAHELGHALDDKMSGWRGVDSGSIQELVRAYRATEQGKQESELLRTEQGVSSHTMSNDAYIHLGIRPRRRKASRYTSWMNKPEEIFARCFETYVAHKVPEWEMVGYAKKVIHGSSYEQIAPIMEKILNREDVKKAMLGLMVTGQR